jgi:hypothetical protein
MNPNQALDLCEWVLARLDVALEMADGELKSASAAEHQIGELVSFLRDRQDDNSSVTTVSLLESDVACVSRRNDPANDNRAQCTERHKIAFGPTLRNHSSEPCTAV